MTAFEEGQGRRSEERRLATVRALRAAAPLLSLVALCFVFVLLVTGAAR